jgi:cystathionine gamma-synthase
VILMSIRDLFRNPVWERNELGRPIPESPHAISVALPRWQDVTGYEEGRPDVIGKLATGYPRFVVHSQVRALASRLGGIEAPPKALARDREEEVRRPL